MEVNLQSVLLKHWGFSSFRPMQEDIIRSVLAGRDTLALLPTGGGKSICYQVPALTRDGLCIVVTPLVALMKDQVQALTNKGIKAIGVYYGLSKTEMDIAIDNCVYGDTKFLYLSPERLTTDLLRSRIGKMKVNLLAIDEAHCISQWGYDFRPPYLRIAEIREFIPDTPLLALTATATKEVIADIQEKLQFRDQQVFQKSFERRNLAYMVFREEDKLNRLLKICKKQQGVGIVYVRNRKKTREIAEYLQLNGVSADFYHAGLTSLERDVKQNAWMKERARVMVSTNAFGMGIDKPNVRFVVHMDLPESPEAYFQEAGRGGRDGKKAFAVLLYHKGDILELEKAHEQSYPPVEFIKKVYNSLGNYYQLALGSGKDLSAEFDLAEFSRNYEMNQALVFNALKFLEKEGYLALSEAFANPSRVMVSLDKEELYRFQVANPKFDAFIKLMLRSYPGIFSGFIKVNEQEMGKRAGLPADQVEKVLHDLHRMGVLNYEKQNQRPMITWLEERLSSGSLRISRENHHERKAFAWKRLKAMIEYAKSGNRCRSLSLLAYFGETRVQRCGQCDVCLERNRLQLSDFEFDQLEDIIRRSLTGSPLPLRDLVATLPTNLDEEKVLMVIRWLRDNGQIREEADGNLAWG